MKLHDLTPEYPVLSMKEKVILPDVSFGELTGGLQANATSVQQGSGNEVFKTTSKGIHLGAAEFADAPFSVDMEGNVVGTTMTLTNTVLTNPILTNVTIDGGAITNITNITLVGGGSVGSPAGSTKQVQFNDGGSFG